MLGMQHIIRMRHIIVCGLSGSTVFFHIISQRHDFRKKKVIEHKKMCVLISLHLLSETFVILRRNAPDMIKNEYWSSGACCCPILMKVEFSRQIFEKCSNIKFNENPSSGSRVVPCGQTEGRTDSFDEANSHFSQLRLRA
jgi:hypothetical protein